MTKKPKPLARKRREAKYFNMSESNEAGMDNAWWVSKSRKGFFLYGNEVGKVSEYPESTIRGALFSEMMEFNGGDVSIDTNVGLEELFEIMTSPAFNVWWHNTESLTINNVELDVDSFKNVSDWYKKICEDKKGKHSSA